MEAKSIKTSGAGEIQIFEVTMDNTEDQDELNRQFTQAGRAFLLCTDEGPRRGKITSCRHGGSIGEQKLEVSFWP